MRRCDEAVRQTQENTFRYTDREWNVIWALIGHLIEQGGTLPPGREDPSPLGPSTADTVEGLTRETLEERISFGFGVALYEATDAWKRMGERHKEEAETAEYAERLARMLSSPSKHRQSNAPNLQWLQRVATDARMWSGHYKEFSAPPPRRNRWPLTGCWNAASQFWIEVLGREVDQSRETITYLLATAAPFRGVAAVTPDSARSYVRDRQRNLAKHQ